MHIAFISYTITVLSQTDSCAIRSSMSPTTVWSICAWRKWKREPWALSREQLYDTDSDIRTLTQAKEADVFNRCQLSGQQHHLLWRMLTITSCTIFDRLENIEKDGSLIIEVYRKTTLSNQWRLEFKYARTLQTAAVSFLCLCEMNRNNGGQQSAVFAAHTFQLIRASDLEHTVCGTPSLGREVGPNKC